MKTRRLIVALAIVLLALVAAPRLRIDYAATVAMPEIAVSLSLPPGAASDPAETTARWLVPIESAIRSLGDVAGTRGQVSGNDAELTVRFRGDVDPELKTARLLSDLAPLRAKLPRDASIDVRPSMQGGSRPNLVLAVRGRDADRAARRIAEELRTADGVRDVRVWGEVLQETSVRLRDDAPPSITASAVREAIDSALHGTHIGAVRNGSRTLPLDAAATAARIDEVRIADHRLTSIANVSTAAMPQVQSSRLDGKPAVLLFVMRDESTSPFRFDNSVRERLAANVEVISNDAADLRRLLLLLTIGALAATLLLGSYVPVAIAIAANVAWLASIDVDASALIAAAIAIAGIAPLARMRRDRGAALIAAAAIAMLPVAVTLGSRALMPFIIGPARAFMIAGLSAICATMLLPATRPLFATHGLFTRRLLRNAASVVLAVTTAGFGLYAWCGTALDPKGAGRIPERGRLYVRVALPSGATLAQSVRAVENVESAAGKLSEIKRIWSIVSPENATSVLELTRAAQSPTEVAMLRVRLRSMIVVPGVVSIEEGFDRSAASRLSDDLEERPETNEEGWMYRFIMHGTNLDGMRRTADTIERRLKTAGLASRVDARWGATSSRVELVPHRDTTPQVAAAIASSLVERTVPAPRVELSDGRFLTVSAARAPRTYDDVPRERDLFATPLRSVDGVATVLSAFTPRASMVPGSAQRELGRFVLPITVNVGGHEEAQILDHREKIDRLLTNLAMPPDVSLARPSLSKLQMSREKLRAIGLATLLPLLLFAIGAIALSSTRAAFVALAPAGAAVSLTGALMMITSAAIDEPTLLAMSGAACCITAMAIIAMRVRSNVSAYRMLRHASLPAVGGSLAALLMLVPAAFIEASLRGGWRQPLLAAATMLACGSALAPMLSAAIGIVARDLRRRTSTEGQTMRHPAVWNATDDPTTLSVQNVTKVYAGGFRALHRVSFELRPGVVGLLGPNGAGKTTLLRILTGLLMPTRGEVAFRGVPVVPENLAEYRKAIGFLPQEFNAWSGFTAEEFLDFWAIERGINDPRERAAMIGRVLEEVDLSGSARRRVRDFSGGMRQRIGIARALLGDPPILIADEPTTGLDIESRARFRDLMRGIARDRVVILSTHIAGDVEATASRILLLDRGTIRYDGTPESLIARAQGRVFEEIVSEADARHLSRKYRVTTRVRVRDGIRIRAVVPPDEPLPARAVEPSLEEAYLADIATRRAMKTSAFAFLSEASR
ncbi:MAG: type transport system ATP-binding protein [Acidobacteriota bacterium]|nr:type transport system ATP-binding protein [Acidobacteriota bacterium]